MSKQSEIKQLAGKFGMSTDEVSRLIAKSNTAHDESSLERHPSHRVRQVEVDSVFVGRSRRLSALGDNW